MTSMGKVFVVVAWFVKLGPEVPKHRCLNTCLVRLFRRRSFEPAHLTMLLHSVVLRKVSCSYHAPYCKLATKIADVNLCRYRCCFHP